MTTCQQLAKHLRELHFGKNWTWVNMKDSLDGLTWKQATQKVGDFNTIAVLVNHCTYYVRIQQKVLMGQPLEGTDQLSFEEPAIHSQKDWNAFLKKTWEEVEALAQLIEQMPESQLNEIFREKKYGTYHRNLMGMIEHTHYHLGQIVLLRKWIESKHSN